MGKVGHERNRLPVSFTINSCVDTEDSRFLAITIDVLHTGLNFNGSIFDKEVVDANADSIMNTPVLGYIALNPDGEFDFSTVMLYSVSLSLISCAIVCAVNSFGTALLSIIAG